jgi:hypothetical protein
MLIPNPHLSGGYILKVNLATRASGKAPAERSLKIAKFNNGDGGIGIALKMPGLRS